MSKEESTYEEFLAQEFASVQPISDRSVTEVEAILCGFTQDEKDTVRVWNRMCNKIAKSDSVIEVKMTADRKYRYGELCFGPVYDKYPVISESDDSTVCDGYYFCADGKIRVNYRVDPELLPILVKAVDRGLDIRYLFYPIHDYGVVYEAMLKGIDPSNYAEHGCINVVALAKALGTTLPTKLNSF